MTTVPRVKNISVSHNYPAGTATTSWGSPPSDAGVVGVVFQCSAGNPTSSFVDSASMLVEGRSVLVGMNIHELAETKNSLLWRLIAFSVGRDK